MKNWSLENLYSDRDKKLFVSILVWTFLLPCVICFISFPLFSPDKTELLQLYSTRHIPLLHTFNAIFLTWFLSPVLTVICWWQEKVKGQTLKAKTMILRQKEQNSDTHRHTKPQIRTR